MDISWKGRDISAVFHVDNEAEATTMLSYLPVFLEEKYGEQIWKWFSVGCKDELSAFKWDPEQKCVVEIVNESAGFLDSFHGGALADWEEVDENDIAGAEIPKMTFDLGFHFNLKPREEGGAGFDDGLSLASMRTGASNATAAAANTNSSIVIDLAEDSPDPSTLNHGNQSADTPAANAASAQQTGVSNSNE